MSLEVVQVKNPPLNSNTYIIYDRKSGNESIIIDPGNNDISYLQSLIEEKKLLPRFILLTHEHFDHIAGVEPLRDSYNGIKVIASEICSRLIQNDKKNMSAFFYDLGFVVKQVDITIEDVYFKLDWNGYTFKFYVTKGHSEGAICIYVDNFLFTGDTLINGNKTVTRLPGGSKNELKKTLSFIFSTFSPETLVFPGHGEPFYLYDVNLKACL